MDNEIVEDGSTTIFLSTKGTNQEDVPEALVKFLNFVGADNENSTADFENDFVEALQKSISNVKKSREMEERFMLFEEMLKDERREGKAEGTAENVVELLEDIGTLSEELREQIMEETDLSKLKKWLKLAAKAQSIEQFMSEM